MTNPFGITLPDISLPTIPNINIPGINLSTGITSSSGSRNKNTSASTLSKFTEMVNKTFSTARDNLFKVAITLPPSLSNSVTPEMLELYAESTSMPSRNIMTEQASIEGPQYDVPYGSSYEPIGVTFYLDKALLIRKAFIAWNDLVYDPVTHGINFLEVYAGKVIISALDHDKSKVLYSIELDNAYPKSIGEVHYTTAGQGDVITMSVEFVYDHLTEK